MSEQAEAASPATAASTDAGTPQIDTDAVTFEQLDQLFETGSAELPVKSGGEEKKSQVEPKAKDETPVKAGEVPPVVEAAAPVEETRTPEQIETAVTTAVEAVKAEGGDQAAQDVAAEAARQPVKAEEAPKVEPVVKAKDPDPEPEEKSRRFRVKDRVAQAALEVYKSFEDTDTPITLAEAERRVRGGEAAPKPAPAPKVDVPNTVEVVSTLETEVTALKDKLTKAGADEGLFNADIAKLQIELSEKTADLKLAQRDLRDEKEAAEAEAEALEATWKQTVDNSRAEAIKLYPDVASDETKLGKAVAERIDAMRDKAHPDHQLLFTGSAPLNITRLVALELGIQPTTAKTPVTPPAKPAAPPKPKRVEPASGALSSAAAAASKPEDAKKAVEYLKSDKATLDDLDKAFGASSPLQTLIA